MTTPSPQDWNGHVPNGSEDALRDLLDSHDPEDLRRSAQGLLDALTALQGQALAMMANIEKHCAEKEGTAA